MKNKIYYIFISLFLLIITAPFWGISFNQNNNNNEKRVLTKIEDIKNFHSLKEFITDNHGFRTTLSNWGIHIYVNYLKESPLPERVQFGINDFLFSGNLQNNTYNIALGVAKFNEEDVLFSYNNILEIQQLFENLDIDFYLVITPNKTTIYPEYLELKPNNSPRLMNEIIKKLEQTDLNLIDLRSFIKNKKDRSILYYKNDTHWNNYAALLATKEVLNKINKKHNVSLINEDDYIIEKQIKYFDGDLSNMLNLKSEDVYYNVSPKNPMIIEDTLLIDNPKEVELSFAQNKSLNNGIKAMIIRDSFFSPMYEPFMHSVETASIFRGMNINIKIKKEDILNEIKRAGKPHFAVYQVVERNVNLVAIR